MAKTEKVLSRWVRPGWVRYREGLRTKASRRKIKVEAITWNFGTGVPMIRIDSLLCWGVNISIFNGKEVIEALATSYSELCERECIVFNTCTRCNVQLPMRLLHILLSEMLESLPQVHFLN